MRILTTLLVFGVAASACIGTTAIPASAAPANTLTPSGEFLGIIYTGITALSVAEHIELDPGTVTENNVNVVDVRLVNKKVAGRETPQGTTMKWDNHTRCNKKKCHDETRAVSVVYPIKLDGKPTDFWLRTPVRTTIPSVTRGQSEVFQGRPGTPGSEEPTWSSPFWCETHQHGANNDHDFTVGFVALAEASAGLTFSSRSIAPSTPAQRPVRFTTGRVKTTTVISTAPSP